MKRSTLLLLAGLATVASAGKYGTAGCGLGALVFGDQPGMVQIVAATTNGIYGNQTSAITTGTSNCSEDGVALVDREKELFAEANFQNLRQEMAQGSGENLQVLASLYGCKDQSQFSGAVRSRYSSLSEATDAASMIQQLDALVATSCTRN